MPEMASLSITANLEVTPWDDLGVLGLNVGPLGHRTARIERVGLLPNGTAKGHPTVMLLVHLPDGRRVVAETTWRLLSGAVRALGVSPVVEIDEVLNPTD